LCAALLDEIGCVRVRRFFGFSPVVNLFGFLSTGDAVILHPGKFPNAARHRTEMFQWQIKSNIAVKFAIRRIAGITFFRAPDLATRIAVASERRRPRRGVTRRVNRALRLRVSQKQSVGVENEPAIVRVLQNRIESRPICAFRQPKPVRRRIENIDKCVAADQDLRSRRFR